MQATHISHVLINCLVACACVGSVGSTATATEMHQTFSRAWSAAEANENTSEYTRTMRYTECIVFMHSSTLSLIERIINVRAA